MKEKFKIISRLLKADAITDDEACLLLETEKEYIYGYYNTYNPWIKPYQPYTPYYGTTGYSNTTLSTSEESDMKVSNSISEFIKELRSS